MGKLGEWVVEVGIGRKVGVRVGVDMRRATCDVRDRLSTLRLQVTKATNMCQSQNGFRPLRREFHVSQPTCQCVVLPSDRIGFCLVLWNGDVP